MANTPITTLRNVQLTLGGAPLFTSVDISLYPGERTALVGRNGAGKSTLMRILAGELEADSGDYWRQPGATLQYLKQEPDFSGFKTALEFACTDLDEFEQYRAEAELGAFGVDPEANPANMSGGQARRLALARAFATDPDILMLDEPTNHLDIDAIEMLEERLNSFRGAILLVSHDRRFMDNVTTAIAWLRLGQVRKLDRGYAHFDEWAEQVEEEETRAREKLDTQLKAEARWMARGVTGRRKRNQGRLSRVHEMRATARELRGQALAASAGSNLTADEGQASSKLVFEAKNISKHFDGPNGKLTICEDFSLKIMRRDRIGLIGANGTGKSTLLKLLLGEIEPDFGTIRSAKNLSIAYLDQTRDTLRSDETLWENMAPSGGDQIMVRGHPKHVAAYAKDFMFKPEQLRQPVHALSGGERNRLMLALALAHPSNLLVLDEPTNDLDIETLDLLEEMLADYDGTLILVSHDRAFVDGVVTSILTPEGNGQWLETPGGYSDYLRQKQKNAPDRNGTAKTSTTSSQRNQKTKTKLTFKDQHRSQEIERLVPEREAEIRALETELADPALFEKDNATFNKKAARLDAARLELEGYEEEWLELEEKKEQLSINGD
ncbi:MAG: elongation factor 3 [Hirschia sp.]|nr:elongation factor 3 [Hirschia sp.]MBF19347.1 elongation factor 3 [Hirschia sp.]